jgi:hypothetical protein
MHHHLYVLSKTRADAGHPQDFWDRQGLSSVAAKLALYPPLSRPTGRSGNDPKWIISNEPKGIKNNFVNWN